MKIERINENQIRCTLNRQDLSEREIHLSELAYGSDKANALFRDMMQQASRECDFSAEDQPLMIEAIPVSQDCLVLLVTKYPDTDELDPRFSNFTSIPEKPQEVTPEPEEKQYADEILSCFEHLSNILGEKLSSQLLGDSDTPDKSLRTNEDVPTEEAPMLKTIFKIYLFTSLDGVIKAAKTINKCYHGENTLYKDPATSLYYLVINLSEHTAGEFNKVCNILSEYGSVYKVTQAGVLHFEEHYEVIVRNKATQVLSKM